MNPNNERSIAASKLTQPLKWHSNGGKHYLAPKLIELFPPHVHYVEPYFGGGSVLLAKSGEGVSEVVNDLNKELTEFWRVIGNAEWFSDFQRAVETIPFSEVEFDQAAFPGEGTGLLYRAVAFFIRARQSRQGLMKDFATLSRNRVRRGMNEQASSWLTAIEGLPDVHERLKRVVILNRPALEVIQQQDGPNTFFYLDPPYVHSSRVTTSDYDHEMTERDHQKLLDLLAGIEGKFMLSGYPSVMYADMTRRHGWNLKDFDLPNNASSKATKERKVERVWMNY